MRIFMPQLTQLRPFVSIGRVGADCFHRGQSVTGWRLRVCP